MIGWVCSCKLSLAAPLAPGYLTPFIILYGTLSIVPALNLSLLHIDAKWVLFTYESWIWWEVWSDFNLSVVRFKISPRLHLVHWRTLSRMLILSGLISSCMFSSVLSLRHVQLFATPWLTARQASLSITNSQSSLRIMSIESVMPSNQLVLCHRLLHLSSIFPSIRIFSNELILHIRC